MLGTTGPSSAHCKEVVVVTELQDKKHRRYYPIAIPANSTGNLGPLSGAVLLGGWSFMESTGNASAVLRIWDGGSTGGAVAVLISLSPGQSIRDVAPGDGIVFNSACTVAVASGAIEGSLWVVDL